jgi:uncharacterized protein Yka (UPF0111/DUF47 family)
MAKKKNPQDATLRNVRAAHARIDVLERQFDKLERRTRKYILKLVKKVKKLKHG